MSRFVACAILALGLASCSGGGSGGGGTTPPAQTNVSISGTVSGTRIVVMNDNDQILAEDDTAGRPPSTPGQFPFTLANVPVGQNLRLFFVSNGTVFPFYLGSTNVFTFNSAGPINLGFVTMDMGTGRATPEFPPQNVTPKPENPNIPPGLIPGAVPTVSVTSPAAGSSVAVGPVTISFKVQNHTIGNPDTSHLHFYLDSDGTAYHFYGGNGINEANGVLYNGAHTHFVHWKSNASFDIFGLPSTAHTVLLVLADQNHNQLANPEATKTLNFTVEQPPAGELDLVPVISGLNFPAAMATAPDGRIFVTELVTGNIRVVTPTATLPWQLQDALFAHLLDVESGNERGLLGIAVDPNFSQNGFVYAFYTAAGPTNRVVRFTATTSGGNTVATPGSPPVIFDNIPAALIHNGGFIQFGPDGKLYIFAGENDEPQDAQNLNSLRGKILRINSNGTIPPDNPFSNSAIYSYGHRNSFGFTFHPHTNDLWETENGAGDNDQINRIIAGKNYGWPICPGICNNPLYIDPIITFTPPIAPTGIIAIPENSSTYPVAYRNNLLFVDFNGGKIRRVVLSGVDLTQLGTSSIAYNGGNGNLLSLMLGADGFVYVSNTNSIFRVVLNSP